MAHRSETEEGITFRHDDRETSVWLVRDADDYRAMHPMIELRQGEERTVFEVSGWSAERPIQSILALAGFTGGGEGGGRIAVVPSEVPVVPLRGFVLRDPAKAADVQMTLRLAMTGRLGGFHPIVQGQTGFHAAAWAFEYVWNAAGCPPVKVCHPEMVDGPRAGDASPGAIAGAAERNRTLAAVRDLEGAKPTPA